MALSFDGSTNELVVADHQALSFPGTWSIGGWFRTTDHSGGSLNVLAAWGGWGASPSFMISQGESGYSRAYQLRSYLKDANGTTISLYSDATPNDHVWHHVLFGADSDMFYCWIDGSKQTTTVPVASMSHPVDVAGVWYFAVQNGNGSLRYPGELAEWARWNRLLGDDEVTSLASGAAPVCLNDSLVWWLPMLNAADERWVGLTVTDNSDGPVDHPASIYYPARPSFHATIFRPKIFGP